MSGSQQLLLGGIPTAVPVDPYFYSVTSLLHGDGVNGGQNNTFLDSSSNNFTITRNGNTTQGSFSPFSQTGWGNYFDGNGDELTLSNTTAAQVGSGDFSIECFVFPTRQTNTFAQGLITYGIVGSTTGTSYIGLQMSPSGYMNFFFAQTASPDLADPNLLPINQWSHVVACRSGSTLSMFVNGFRVATTTTSATVGSSGDRITIGGQWFANASTRQLQGYISNARIVKGSSAYSASSSTLTIPTTPLTAITNTSLLTCQSNRFIDNSTNNFTITRNGDVSVQPFSPFNPTTAYSTSAVGGSGYFDGSGDYLSMTSGTSLGSGDFTIGCWVYLTAAPGAETPVGSSYNYYTSGQNGNFVFRVGTTNLWRSFDGQGNQASITGTYTWTLNTWMYMAWVRSGSTLTVYKDGVSLGSVTDSKTLSDSANGYAIGADRINGSIGTYLTGYLSGFRILVGTADSTVPTAPPTAIANTQLLCNFTNGAIFDNAAVADYETVGNAQISTSVKKYGTGSMYFDGTGDYLASADKEAYSFGSGDFTVEAWIYPTSFANEPMIMGQWSGDLGGTGLSWALMFSSGSTGYLRLITSSNGSSVLFDLSSSPYALSLNTWYHVAAVRIGTVFKLYVNGNQVATTTNSSALYNATNVFTVGSESNSPTQYFNGYIDDIRISKGIARYPYNFTPPTAEFPNIGGTVTLTADPYFEYTTLLLPGNGTNGAQNNTFLDSSTNAFTITRNGNTTQGTFSPFSQTGWGNYLNGSTDYLTAASNAAFAVPAEYTVEFWAYQVASPTNYASYFMVNASGGLQIGFNTAGGGVFGVANNFVAWQLTTAAFPLNQWTHVAITRDSSNVTRIFYNGTQQTSGTITTSYAQGELRIGNSGANNGFINGYVSNMRYLKGTALYTSNFTPPTSPLTAITNTQLLTCQSNRFVDNSSNAFALTTTGSPSIQAFSPFNPTAAWSAATNGGSGYFDGAGDYLSIPDNDAWTINADYTIEAWVYANSFPQAFNQVINHAVNGTNLWTLFYNTSTGWGFSYNNGGVETRTDRNQNSPLGNWVHVAIVKSGTTGYMFLNGQQAGATFTFNNVNNFAANLIVGGWVVGNTDWWSGYITNLRILKGTALYTSNFTPPTSPLTAITNTQLLLNYINAGIYDATSKNDLETVGNAQISTTQSKFGGSSMYFDGTGDWLVLPPNPPNNLTPLGTGDFTVEFWVRFSSFYDYISVVSSTRGANGFNCGSQAAAQIVWYANGAERVRGTTTLSANTWYHIAFVRYSGTLKGYVNGVQEGTTYADSINYSTPIIRVGDLDTGGEAFTGYLQDLRITKGVARYTSNFTPPSTAFLTL